MNLFIFLVWFVLLLLLSCEGHDFRNQDSENPAQQALVHRFENFIASLPSDLENPDYVLGVNAMMKIMEMYDEAKETIRPYDLFYENVFHRIDFSSFIVDIHTTVAFVGIPQNALPRIRELWFDDMGRQDKLEGYDGTTGNTTLSSGDVSFKHHFHVLETSFHAHDVIQSYFKSIVQPEQNEMSDFEYYFNAWEVEALLDSLTTHMRKAGREHASKSALMVYVLNLQNGWDDKVYSYRNGFSEWDMDIIRADNECKALALTVLNEFPHGTRRNIDAEKGHLSLNEMLDMAHVLTYEQEAEKAKAETQHKSGNEEWLRENGFGMDGEETAETAGGSKPKDESWEVKSSREWARDFTLKAHMSEGKRSVVQRAISVLKNDIQSPVFDKYRHVLARSILTKGNMMDDTPTSNAKDFLGRTDNMCSSTSWAGSSGVAWLDITTGASEALPVRVADGYRKTHNRHHSHANGGSRLDATSHGAHWRHAIMDLNELHMKGLSGKASGRAQQTGANADIHEDWREVSIGHETESLKNSLAQQLTHVENLLTRLSCHSVELVEHVTLSHLVNVKGSTDHFESIAVQIRQGMDATDDDRKLPEQCALLLLERVFVQFVLDISEATTKSVYQGFKTKGQGITDDVMEDTSVYEEDAMVLLNQLLSAALDQSNMFVGKGHFARNGFSDPLVNHAFAKLAKMVLRSTRQLITRPLMLQPQQSIYRHRQSGFPQLTMAPPQLSTKDTKSLDVNLLSLFHDMHSAVAKSTGTDVIHTRDTMYVDAHYLNQGNVGPAWEDMLPSLYIPKHVEIEIFVVVGHKGYEPIDDVDGFHMPLFMDQLEKLRLPNQYMTISVHSIEATEEPSLMLGIASCRRTAVTKRHTSSFPHSDHGNDYLQRMFLSAECLWRHFQHIDDDSQDAATWLKRHPDTLFSNVQHLPIFLLSMDDHDPLYLARDGQDSLHSAVHFGDSVIIVQNRATEHPNGYTCNNKPVLANLRNPLGPALSVVAGALLGLAGVEPDVELPIAAHHHDRAAISCGGSPFFRGLAALHPLYSDFDLMSGHRNRILRSLDFSSKLAYENFRDQSYSSNYQQRLVYSMHEHTAKVKEAIHRFDWARAAALANTLLKLVVEERQLVDSYMERDVFDVDQGRAEHAKENAAKKGNSKLAGVKKVFRDVLGSIPQVALGATVSGIVTYLLFVLFSSVLTTSSNRQLPS